MFWAAAAWLALIIAGLGVLLRYSLTAGREWRPPAVWPSASRLERAADRYTLVMAAHPRCPCTRASLSELAVIMTHCRDRLVARVVFVQPQGFTEQWVKDHLWRMAAAIPGVQPMLDPRGLEARRFGALTSGQAVLYDPGGRQVFSGGITGARGHAGANAGRRAVVAVVRHGGTERTRTPVFGCSLNGPATTGSHEQCKQTQCPGA